MKFTAYIWDHSLEHLRPDNLTLERLKPYLHLEPEADILYPGKVKVGELDIDIELLPPDEIVGGAALALRMRAKEIRREAGDRARQLEAKAEQLLAIENKPTNLEKA